MIDFFTQGRFCLPVELPIGPRPPEPPSVAFPSLEDPPETPPIENEELLEVSP